MITSHENLPKEQIRQAHRQLEDGIFVSTPSTSLPHLPRPTPSSLTHRLWHRCLDYHFGSKRGLTKVSMATVQSVNHAAANVSSPSHFPFSPSFSPNLQLVHNPSLFSRTHAYLFCISPSSLRRYFKTLRLDRRYLLWLTFLLCTLSPPHPPHSTLALML